MSAAVGLGSCGGLGGGCLGRTHACRRWSAGMVVCVCVYAQNTEDMGSSHSIIRCVNSRTSMLY